MNFNSKNQKAAFAEIAKNISIIDDGDLMSSIKNLGQ
jgi:hypothetical protein